MLGYIVTLVAAGIGTLACVYMDLEAPSHFFSLFLPLVFASSLLCGRRGVGLLEVRRTEQ